MVDEALAQFQQAQKGHSVKNKAVLYTGRCLKVKGRYDMAIEQYKLLVDKMLVMDKEKFEVLYELATAYELNNDKDHALECYKEIYQHDITYKDVEDKINSFY